MSSTNNIVLIGFMASGKSSVGRLLAQKTDRFFIDSDNLIESSLNNKISDIFETNGEEYFRQKEQHCLDWMVESLKNSVISTGGGMPIYSNGIKKLGKVVFLNADFEVIKKRLENDKESNRPLIKNLSLTKTLYENRVLQYDALADIIVDANQSMEDILERLLKV